MPTWPATVPFFNDMSNAQRTGPQGAVVRSSMSVGPDKVRRRSTASPQARTGGVAFLTTAQLATFEAFFRDDLLDGALSFDAFDPMDRKNVTCRFVGSYTVTRRGGRFGLTAELERLP